MRKYQKPVFNAALKLVNDYDEAQDIAQTAFVKAFERLESYNPKYKFFSWMYRITMNTAIDYQAQTRRRAPVRASLESPGGNPADILEQKEVNGLVQDAIGELSIDYRALIVLKHFTDLSMSELAYILDIPVRTIKSRLYTARRRLANLLRQKGVLGDD